ncbi:MAG: alpha-amylase [Clostridiales bacterium]|nr:alpha-amylase [Clostridiales bacterium]
MDKWFEKAVFYHMYPIGMTGAPRRNEQTEVTHRFGELEEWLPHIQSLGCTAIYIGPLFESSTHGYDTRDYRLVDRRLGDNEDFRHFVEKAHKLGIRVVVDGVFNHTGREFFAFQDIQRNRERSPYCSWYKGLNFGWDNPYHDGFGYEAWRNCFELVNLNYWEPKVREYILDVIGFWIKEFDIDGIRLDCADCLDFSFMEEMRRYTSARKEDFWLMGEVIHGDYSRYVKPSMLDSVTNYELHKGLYSGHNDHNYFEIAHSIRRQFDSNGGIYRGLRLYSFVDNHDVDRIASKLKVPEHIYPVYTLMYTLPGIPSIYYGSEWGIKGRKQDGGDDCLRPAVNLKEALSKVPDPKLLEWVKTLGKIHGEQPALAYGAYRELLLTNRQYAFARILDGTCVIVAVNNDEKDAELRIPIPVAGRELEDLTGVESPLCQGDAVLLKLEPNESRILHIR